MIMETVKGLLLMEEEAASKKYVLEEKDNKVVISKDNVAKVFAMMANSPQYKRAANINNENSSSRLFNNWKKDGYISIADLKFLLERLNAENSTHTYESDILQIRDNIIQIANGNIDKKTDNDNIKVDNIKKCLEKARLCLVEEIIAKCNQTPLSFATKFCHYACVYMFKLDENERDKLDENERDRLDNARDNFPIFDDIMRKNLGKYSNAWETEKTKGKLKRNFTPKELADSDSEFGISDFYKFYRDCIKTIADENNVSKTGVEQLIWYYHNGSK